jgi:hypothetical protein
MLECPVAVGHSSSVADVESRTLPAWAQPCGRDRFMTAIDTDDDGRIATG